ncbi:MAG: hypothetical protein A2V83_10385 [Nitrospirae bacterium RBG_16_64_22]|nr:MAG: hypothetical protein A2V83_10385 [Nitrospirae bacterium RBG_16_64_22]
MMANDRGLTAELEGEIARLKADLEEKTNALRSLEARVADLDETRRAMLYMLEDLEQSNRAVSRAGREWTATVDAISNPLFVHDSDLRVIRANRAYARIAGMDFNEILGRPYYEVFPRMEGPFNSCRKAMDEGGEEEEEEEVAVPALGKIFWVRSFAARLDEGRRPLFIHVMEDITEERRAKDKLRDEIEVTTHLLMMAQAAAQTTDMEKLLESVAHCSHRIMACDVMLIYLWDRERRVFQPAHQLGLDPASVPLFRTTPLDEKVPLVETLMRDGKPVIERNAADDPESGMRTTGMPLDWLTGIRALAANPLMGRSGPLGLMVCLFSAAREFGERDRRIMTGIASQVSTAVEEARLYKDSIGKAMELAHQVETVRVMHEIDRSILSTLDPESLLETSARLVARLIPCDRAIVALVDEGKRGFVVKAGFGFQPAPAGAVFPFADTSATDVIRTGTPQYIPNLGDDRPALLPLEEKLADAGFLSSLRVPLTVKGEIIGVLSVGARRPSAFTPGDMSALEKLSGQVSVALENTRLLTDLADLFMSTITALSEAIDAKSPWTKGHSERVAGFAVAVAKEMGRPEKEVRDLRIAGLLHDVGKIGTYDVLLDKPGRLTEEEYAAVREHTARGAKILSSIKQLAHVVPWVRGHHEYWNGKGYPDGLKGEEIPLQARILAVADTFDSMTAERPYRQTPGREKAAAELRAFSGAQFDPAVVDAFLRVL